MCGQEKDRIAVEPEDETENGASTVKKVQHLREPSREERG